MAFLLDQAAEAGVALACHSTSGHRSPLTAWVLRWLCTAAEAKGLLKLSLCFAWAAAGLLDQGCCEGGWYDEAAVSNMRADDDIP